MDTPPNGEITIKEKKKCKRWRKRGDRKKKREGVERGRQTGRG